VTVHVIREGKTVDIQTKVGEMEDEGATASETDASHKTLGVSVQNLTPQIAGELGLKDTAGIVVTNVAPGSPAAEAMIRPGDVIKGINLKPVKNVDDFMQKIDKTKAGDPLLLLIAREQNSLFVTITLK
jgi:serine protease Do